MPLGLRWLCDRHKTETDLVHHKDSHILLLLFLPVLSRDSPLIFFVFCHSLSATSEEEKRFFREVELNTSPQSPGLFVYCVVWLDVWVSVWERGGEKDRGIIGLINCCYHVCTPLHFDPRRRLSCHKSGKTWRGTTWTICIFYKCIWHLNLLSFSPSFAQSIPPSVLSSFHPSLDCLWSER